MKHWLFAWSWFAAVISMGAGAGAATLLNGPAIAAEVPTAPLADLGRASSETPVHLVVILKCRHEDDLDAFVDGRNAAESLKPQAYLTARQFRDWFSPTPETYLSVEQRFVKSGFRIERTYANRTVVDIVGPARNVERTFATELHAVRSGRFLGLANMRTAAIPADIAPFVDGVVGFDDIPLLHSYLERGPRQTRRMPASMLGPDTGYSPMVLRASYDLPVQHQVASGKGFYDGRGQSAGIVINTDVADSDIATFLKYFGISRQQSIVRVAVDGGPGGFPSPESTLDVETIASLAPGAGIVLYLVPSLSSTSTLDAFAQVNSDDVVGVVNNSWGDCETEEMPSNYPQMSDVLAKEGAALGIVYVAATGDNGVQQCFHYPPPPLPWGVSSPASSPHFVAVGGTTLFVDSRGRYKVQYGWWGSGGGISARFAKPNYQSGRRITLKNPHRSLPDIAFDADPGTGVAFYWQGKWQGPLGGTSLAAPIFCALTAEVAGMHGKRVANMLASLYSTYERTGYDRAFTDVTSGFNGFYYAVPGFDRVTGIGSVDGWKFGEAASL